MAAWANTKIVRRRGINVQFGWNTRLAQCLIHQHAVLSRADDIRPSVGKENWRRSGRDHQARCQFILFFGLQVTRIHENRKIGSAADFVCIIHGLIGSFFKLGGRGNCQMASRREAHDADMARIYPQFLRFAPYQDRVGAGG